MIVIITPEMAAAELDRRGKLGNPKNLGNEALRKVAGQAMKLSQDELWEISGLERPTKRKPAKRKPAKGKAKAAAAPKTTRSTSTLGLNEQQVLCRQHIIESLGGGPGNEGWDPVAYRTQMDLAGIPRKGHGKDKGKVTPSNPALTDRYAKTHGIA